jgi:hypothetical protein
LRAALAAAGLALGCSGCAVAGHGSTPVHAAREVPRSAPLEPPASRPADTRLAAPVAASPAELSEIPIETRVEPYQSRDSVWVPGQPIVVNRDFDFGVALGAGDIGPGIAAAQRRQGNLALAQRLSSLEPIDAAARVRALCSQPHALCTRFAGAHVRVYGLLFGDREARLRIIFEPADGNADVAAYSALTDARAVSAFAEPQTLLAMFDKGLAAVADLLDAGDAPAPASTATGQCKIGDRAQMRGQVIANDDQRVVLLVSDPRPTRLSCPKEAFSLAAEPPAAPH